MFYPLNTRMGSSHSLHRHSREKTHILALSAVKPRFRERSAPSLVTTPTELPQLLADTVDSVIWLIELRITGNKIL